MAGDKRGKTLKSTIELCNLELDLDVGTYANGDVVPDRHVLDLTLSIDPSLVLIAEDEMERVFDYDPLIERITALAEERHYETQERFLTLILDVCADYAEIKQIALFLRKGPVSNSSGTLGIRLALNEDDLARHRARSYK